MRLTYFIICSFWLLASQLSANADGAPERVLSEVLIEFQSIEKEIDDILRIKTGECGPGSVSEKTNYCSLKSYCERPEVNKDSKIIYQNTQGEKIVNESYYLIRNEINSCLREKFADEITLRREELTERLGSEHLKKIIAANKRLSALTKKYNQGAKIQKVSAEILNLSLESALVGSETPWGVKGSSKSDLLSLLATAEKRAKTKLHEDIKKSLVEIEYLKSSPQYQKEIEEFEREILPQHGPVDPFYDWGLLTDAKRAKSEAKMLANRDQLAKKAQGAYALFIETQAEIIAYLNEQKNKNNGAQIERIIERVKTIKFNPPQLSAQVIENCKYPNAFYNNRNHTLTICPQYLNFPKSALKETIAHEVAHSFDSCNLSGSFYKKNGPSITEEAPFEIALEMLPVKENYRIAHGEDEPGLNARNKIQDLMRFSDNPFAATLSCLEDKKSVGAKTSDVDSYRKKASERLKELGRLGHNNPDNAEARNLNFFVDNQKNYFDHFQGCNLSGFSDGLGQSQMQEAFADKISSEIMARDLKKQSEEKVKTSVLEIVLSYGNVCSNEDQGHKMLRQFAVKEGCPHFLENKTNEMKILDELRPIDPDFDPHPVAEKRIEKMLLAHPAIRKTLNCPVDRGVKYCE